MFCRDVLKRGTRIATALALVAAVIVSPIRSSKSAGGTSRLRQNLAIPLPKPTPPSMTSVSSPSALVKALASEKRGGAKENEEKRTGRPARPFAASTSWPLTLSNLLGIWPLQDRFQHATRSVVDRGPGWVC